MSELYRFLGRTLAAQGKYREAVPLYRKAVEEIEPHVEADDPHLTPSLHELSRALWRAGEKGESQTTLDRACRLAAKAFTDTRFEARDAATGEAVEIPQGFLVKVGGKDEWLLYQGEFSEAAAGLRASEAQEAKQPATGRDPQEMPAAELLAEAEMGLGNAAEARAAYLRAAEQWERRLSAGHPWALQCRARAEALGESRAA